MSGRMMNSYRFLLTLSASILLAATSACNPGDANGSNASAETPPLEGARIGGNFTLTNQDGGKTSFSDFDGKYRLIYFGYTYCPDVCPVDLQRLMQGLRLVEKDNPELGASIQPIFITIDPQRDKPAQIKQYISAFHPRLLGLTGTADEIADAAQKYIVTYQKRETPGSSEYLMDHSNLAYLMGPGGNPIALIPTGKGPDGNEVTPKDVATELEKWAK